MGTLNQFDEKVIAKLFHDMIVHEAEIEERRKKLVRGLQFNRWLLHARPKKHRVLAALQLFNFLGESGIQKDDLYNFFIRYDNDSRLTY